MMRRLLVVLTSLVLAGPASAQGSFETDDYGGTVTVNWTAPAKLNQARCDTKEDVRVTLTPAGSSNLVENATLRVFWQDGGDCTGVVTGELVTMQLEPTDPLVSTTPLVFPDNVVDENGDPFEFDTSKVWLHVPDACPSGQKRTSFALCIAADLPQSAGGSVGTIDTNEPYGWVKFTVDTDPPGVPAAPSVTSLDSRCRVSSSIAVDPEDIAKWRAYIRPLDDATAGQPCDEWTGARSNTISSASTEASVEVSGENGVAYEICMSVLDSFDNEGGRSESATCQPEEECDFIECYPGNLKTGYCGAASAPVVAVLAVLLMARRRQKVERDA